MHRGLAANFSRAHGDGGFESQHCSKAAGRSMWLAAGYSSYLSAI